MDEKGMRKVFTNAKVYTADGGREASAFVVEDGTFTYVGTDEQALAHLREGDIVLDMEGARIIPGMMDTHCHYLALCSMDLESRVEIPETMGHEEVLGLIRGIAESESVEERPVICGLGYGTECIPLAVEMDKAVSDRPVFLLDSGGHSAWMNTKMMERAGIDEHTPDPKPGASYYSRDEQGKPTGQAVETDAAFYVQSKTGFVTSENLIKQLPAMIGTLHSLGITSVYDAGIMILPEREVYGALETFDSTVRFYTSFHFGGTRPVADVLADMKELRAQFASDWLHPTTLKMFMDGTIEAATAWMFDEYLPPAHGTGESMQSSESMIEMGAAAAAEGFNVHIHAIGDRAISSALDVFDALGEIKGTKAIAHVQVLPEDGIDRFGRQKDVFYQTTPVWLGLDQYTFDVLGEERYLRQMPLRSLLEQGTRLTFGSDAPVSGGLRGMNPFANMHAAVNRGIDGSSYIPPLSEGIDITSCIDAYTINGAMQVRADGSYGSITEGKQADFVVLDQDVLAVAPDKIKDTAVVETWARGEMVYRVVK